MARLDERDAPPGPIVVRDVESRLRVGFDLDGSLESLGNSMVDLADALVALGDCDLVRYHSLTPARRHEENRIALRRLWSPLWRQSRGRAIDRLLPMVNVVHVAGLATPPTKRVPLIISLDDLRPLRHESRTRQRVAQLRRAVNQGATLATSSTTAGHEVQSVLDVPRSRVVVVAPAVPKVTTTHDGDDLVVNVTGRTERFLALAPALVRFTQDRGARLVALTSRDAGQRIRSGAPAVSVRSRDEARVALTQARVVVHLSDGARFPSFAMAALSAGVPTVARATASNRELLAGAAALTASDDEIMHALEIAWDNDARRAIMIAAGVARSSDYSPETAARAYSALYHDVVRGWAS